MHSTIRHRMHFELFSQTINIEILWRFWHDLDAVLIGPFAQFDSSIQFKIYQLAEWPENQIKKVFQ